jgi:pimeloyl-ACP methyl ester carboxylesterase
MMRRGLVFGLLIFTAACSGSDPVSDAGTTPDAGPRTFDATVVDVGVRYDSGVDPLADAGFADPATLHEGFVSLEGVQTFIHVRGTLTSTMPPIVVLNAGPMLGHEYHDEPLDFLMGPGGAVDPDRLLVMYDMRATGQSGFGSIESSTITIDAHVEDLGYLLNWVDELTGNPGPVDFLAHGYGTAVATVYAAANPQRIGRMVFVAPYPSNVTEQALWGAEWNSRLNSGDRERLSEITQWNYCFRDFRRCSRDVWNTIGHTWFCPENRNVFDSMTFEHIEIRPFTYYTVIDLRDREFDFQPIMEQISATTTVISGPCDPVPASAAVNYTLHLQNATHHILPGAGHFPMTETPDAFARIVKRALTY